MAHNSIWGHIVKYGVATKLAPVKGEHTMTQINSKPTI